jgi:hypothetical protein
VSKKYHATTNSNVSSKSFLALGFSSSITPSASSLGLYFDPPGTFVLVLGANPPILMKLVNLSVKMRWKA